MRVKNTRKDIELLQAKIRKFKSLRRWLKNNMVPREDIGFSNKFCECVSKVALMELSRKFSLSVRKFKALGAELNLSAKNTDLENIRPEGCGGH